jgi:hypothetical protein
MNITCIGMDRSERANINELQNVFNKKSKYDICVCYQHTLKAYCIMDKTELNNQFKLFRKLQKQKKLTINPKNHRTKFIQNKEIYILVIQSINNDGTVSDANPKDPMGLGFDDDEDGPYLVSGMIYAFQQIENRDNLYKYVMGL